MNLRELITLEPKEFIKSLGNLTWKSLQYRNKWLQKKSEEIWLAVRFYKENWKLYIKIHKRHLTNRYIPNPYFTDTNLVKFGNYLKNKVKKDDMHIKLEDVVSTRWWVDYRATKFIKWFIFYLIKQYYDRN